MAMLPNYTRIAPMQELTVHIELDHNFTSDSYEQELAEFALTATNGELIELPELFA